MINRSRATALPATVALVLAACGSSSSTPVPTTPPTPTASPVAPSIVPSVAPSTAPSGVLALPICIGGATCPIEAGAYVTPTPGGFWPGLALSIGSGWLIGEDDSGELKLYQSAKPDDVLLFWRDVNAVTSSTNGKGIANITTVDGVGRDPASLVAYFRGNSDYKVLSGPESVTTAAGITGTRITMTTSDTAVFGDPDCPDNPRCSAFVRDLGHWGSEFYGIGGSEVSRMFLTEITVDGVAHTLVITLDTPNAAELEAFAPIAQRIIDSVVLPATFFVN